MHTGERSSIAVIGAGVVGLITALELRSRGRDAVIYAPAKTRAAASNGQGGTGGSAGVERGLAMPSSLVAPALFTPYALSDDSLYRRVTEYSFERLSRLARERPEAGVHLGTLHEYRRHPEAPREWLERLMRTTTISPAPTGIADANASVRPHIDMTVYMPWLHGAAESEGVRFVDAVMDSIDEAFDRGHRVVVNCAGLGAARLTGDRLLKPMHGQLLHVHNDIGLAHSVHDDAVGDEVKYVFAFRDRLVLGGSFVAGREDDETDQATIEGIIERCRGLLRLDGHPRWNDLARGGEIRRTAARRPTRGADGVWEDLRLEREDRGAGRTVVHHYGHGRAGASLSWGTGREAAEMACGAG